MKYRFVFAIAVLLAAVSASATPADLFAGYEHARQGLMKASLSDVKAGAAQLASAARAAKQAAVAAKADALASAKDLSAARAGFAAVSDEMIAFRRNVRGDRPVVAYCSMEKKSWLQPAAAPISNPYVAGSMRTCGEIVKDGAGQPGRR